MIEGDVWLKEVLVSNMDCIILAYCFLQSLFPESRLLRALKDGFSRWSSKSSSKSAVAIVAMVIAIGTTQIAMANPFLVCDPQSGVESYLVREAGVETEVLAQADGSIKMDLASVTIGSHTYEVAAKNIWGVSPYVPFSFSRTVPIGPAGLQLQAR